MENNTEAQDLKRKLALYSYLIIALIVVSGVLGWQLFETKSDVRLIAFEKGDVEKERDRVKGELQEMLEQYDDLKNENAELTDEMIEQQKQIKDLLNEVEKNKGDLSKLGKYKKEVGTLRVVLKSYVYTIDSLNVANQALASENIQIKEELGNVKNQNQQLSSRTKEMQGIIKKASVLQAINLSLNAIKMGSVGRQIETNRVSRAEIFKACFTIPANNTTQSGRKSIYIRIVDPSGVTITEYPEEIELVDGSKVISSAKKEFDYTNTQEDMCVYAKPTMELTKGQYGIYLYESGELIAQSSLELN